MRYAQLAEAQQALLVSALAFATDADKGPRLHTASGSFDTFAAALEADLLSIAHASPPRAKPVPFALLRALADREQAPLGKPDVGT